MGDTGIEPGKLDDVLAHAELMVRDDDEIQCPVGFDVADTATRAFIGAGPTALAIRHSGERTVATALRDALAPSQGAMARSCSQRGTERSLRRASRRRLH